MSANNLIKATSEFLDKPFSADLNYTYIQSSMQPGTYTIFKRDKTDPLVSFPIVSLMFGTPVSFAEPKEIIRRLCEVYSELEYKKNQADNKKQKRNDDEDYF